MAVGSTRIHELCQEVVSLLAISSANIQGIFDTYVLSYEVRPLTQAYHSGSQDLVRLQRLL